GARAARAVAVGREPGIACGVRLAPRLVEVFGGRVRVEPDLDDGDGFSAGAALLHLEGELGSILAAERTLLNLLGRLSGI
ncbi:MAG: nicotinate-nucleotide diphosphorylase (carboxylating), partial [Gammaproteobacteria bacterium]|nr:nicotinate-nucleotide diphosphorylase (carboxylating) [Gammaproteobacteria bacterium]NIO24217.1 nicotinate-nucleotide diphosphorylase (carboxylating) [Gammaproteobacteria bacterium]NIT91321.1 nicotinate-nucleotide diphosphorylase (carboxylating) [Gammaproteobacteria bacterium]